MHSAFDLLHDVFELLFPGAAAVGRTAAQCLEHYEKLLDKAQGKEEGDDEGDDDGADGHGDGSVRERGADVGRGVYGRKRGRTHEGSER